MSGYSLADQLRAAAAIEHFQTLDARTLAKIRAEAMTPKHAPVAVAEVPSHAPLTILVIGDSHARHDVPNDRYTLLGRFAAKLRPDVIVDIGDWFDMPSLSSYDVGKACFEGRRYWRDIAAGIDAQERFQRELDRAKGYVPYKLRTLGNHENRIGKVADIDPRFHGLIGTPDLCSAHYGWDEAAFLEVRRVGGVAFSHYFTSGVMGRAIGGETPARMVILKQHVSAVQGHSHLFDYAERTDPSGKRLCAAHAGCYFEHKEDYAGPANLMWRRGLLVLRNVVDGCFDPDWWSFDRIRRWLG